MRLEICMVLNILGELVVGSATLLLHFESLEVLLVFSTTHLELCLGVNIILSSLLALGVLKLAFPVLCVILMLLIK